MYQDNTDLLNDAFSAKLDNPEEKAKLAQSGADFIRDRLREECAFDKVIPPRTVTRAELRPSITTDTLVKLEEIEPNSKASIGSFRGDALPTIISAPRAETPFFKLQSQMSEKEEMELMAYTMPITKIIEDNSVKDIQEIKDLAAIIHIENAVQQMQYDGNGNATVKLNGTNQANGTCINTSVIKSSAAESAANQASFTPFPVEKPDFTKLFNLFSDNGVRLRAKTMLMTDPDWEEINNWTMEDMGTEGVKETTVEGYKYSTLVGRNVIRTVKTDIWRRGNIYCFTAPEFLGRNYILGSMKFYIDKIVTKIRFQAWCYAGFSILNISAVKKMELYAASVTPGATDTGHTARLPKTEDQLFVQNNKVADGKTFPKVRTY